MPAHGVSWKQAPGVCLTVRPGKQGRCPFHEGTQQASAKWQRGRLPISLLGFTSRPLHCKLHNLTQAASLSELLRSLVRRAQLPVRTEWASTGKMLHTSSGLVRTLYMSAGITLKAVQERHLKKDEPAMTTKIMCHASSKFSKHFSFTGVIWHH